MCAKRRVALYGGTFDPVHLGHLHVARAVCQLFETEKVVFIPAQLAPHKIGRPVTAPIHRYAMLALATQEDARLVVSTFELEAPDRRYTIDTLAHFLRVFDDNTDLFFIMGADSWTEIKTWRDWRRVLTMVNHIVVTRPGYDLDAPEEMTDRIIDVRGAGSIKRSIDTSDQKIYLTDAVRKEISATEIRSLAAQGDFQELTEFVPRSVADYIKKYRIYQEPNEV